MKISDKALGYISFAVLILIIAGVAFGMYQAHREASTQAIIDFDELGALSPEDPLTENGYKIGHVGSVKWLGDRSRVSVIFDEPIILREGTRFRNAAFAIMGGRRIEIIRSKTGDILPEDHVFEGEFVPGITESLRHIAAIRDQVMLMRDAILLILSGSDSTSGVVSKYNEAMETVESLLANLDKAAQIADGKVQSILHQADSASENIARVADLADSTLRTVTANANKSISGTQESLKKLSLGIEKIDALVQAVETDSLAKSLLETQDLVGKIDTLALRTSQLIQAINTKGIALYDDEGNKVELIQWKNLNIIGKTAREKAKEKQKATNAH